MRALDVGLVLDLPLVEGSGAITRDASGEGNDGTFKGAGEPAWVEGRNGRRALDFDGGDDYINVGAGASLEPDYVTVSMWVNHDVDQGAEVSLCSSRTAAASGYSISLRDDQATNYVEFAIVTTTSFKTVTYANPPIGSWYHLVCTYDGTNVKIYVNGVQVSTDTHSGTIVDAVRDMFIGAWAVGTAEFDGKLQGIQYWNRGLSDQEIRAVYAIGLTKLPIGRVLDLPMKEASGTVTRDVSGEENNGTVENAPTWITGGGVTLNGTTQYVDVPDDATLSFGNGTTDSAFSIVTKINAVDVTYFCPMGKGVYNTDMEYRFIISFMDDKLYLQCFDESIADCYIGRVSADALTGYEGSDVVVAGSYDGSGASSGFKLYVNGVRVDAADAEQNAGSYVAMENTLGHAVWLGRDATDYSNGSIMRAMLYDRVLDDREMREVAEQLMNS